LKAPAGVPAQIMSVTPSAAIAAALIFIAISLGVGSDPKRPAW
jgi:hypothetical protein